MGKKDTVGKVYFRDPERFAELINTALYHGEKIIRPKDLIPLEREYPSLFGNADRHRDVFMKDARQHILYSLELETETDYSMPERVLVYDACEYEQQIRAIVAEREAGQERRDYRERKSRIREEDFLLPVVTVVLYLGTDHWEGRRKLSELFRVSRKSRELLSGRIPEYDFHLVEADYVNAEDYETDLREFFQAMQCRKDKKKLEELFRSERFRNLRTITAWAIAIHIDRQGLAVKVGKEGVTVCQAFRELMEDMKEEGIKEGIKEGEQRERISMIRQMLREGMEEALIIRIARCSAEEMAAASASL